MHVLRAIVFDFDGVIANSEPLHFRGVPRRARGRRRHAHRSATTTRATSDSTMSGVFEAMGASAGAAWTAARHRRLWSRARRSRLEALERDVSVLFPGAAAAIRRAAAAVPIAIASGALGAEIRRVLDREQI